MKRRARAIAADTPNHAISLMVTFTIALVITLLLASCARVRDDEIATLANPPETTSEPDKVEAVSIEEEIARPTHSPAGAYQGLDKIAGVAGGVIGGMPMSSPARKDQASMYMTGTMPDADESWRYNDDFNTEEYGQLVENPFLAVRDNPLSTFGVDVDSASYSNIRRYIRSGQLPPRDAVRIEEMINYFSYSYPEPAGDRPFSITTEIAECPWNGKNRLLLIGLQGRNVDLADLPPSNLVFLLDVSGSMNTPDKLPLLKSAMTLLIDNLRSDDTVSIAVYAGSAGLVLPPTPGSNKGAIRDAIQRLEAGGSTAGGEGIRLAYATAEEHFVRRGNNRVILATDGDFNIGVTSDGELQNLIEEKRETGIFLTVLGFGTGNIKDSKMELLADKGNGNYAYIDSIGEARKVLVSEMGGTLFTIAKDVKLQLEFNPARVLAYRLIGYENRVLRSEDFNDDRKDSGDMGAGHSVTALYEIVPPDGDVELANIDPLKYQSNQITDAASSGEALTVKVRYKEPDGKTSRLLTRVVNDTHERFALASDNLRFSSAVAELGLLLRDSKFKGEASFEHLLATARDAMNVDEEGYRADFIRLAEQTRDVMSPTEKIARSVSR